MQRESDKRITGSQRGVDLILPYQLRGYRKGTPLSRTQPGVQLLVPVLVFPTDESTPLYREATLPFTPAELDLFIGQLTGLRNWIAEPFRDYDADAATLVAAGIFDRVDPSNGWAGAPVRYHKAGDESGRLLTAEGAVDDYENEGELVSDLRDPLNEEGN